MFQKVAEESFIYLIFKMIEKKYLVYKVSGGLCHMLYEINKAIHFSKLTKRILIIDCMGGAFKHNFNDYFIIPNYEYYTNYENVDKNLFKINEHARIINDIYFLINEERKPLQKITLTPLEIINSNEKIIYVSFIRHSKNFTIPWYIKANKSIVDKISINKIEDKYIGIHYRNTDMKHNLEQFIPKLIKFSKDCKIIYLGTDDCTGYDRLNKLLDKRFKILQYTKPFNNNGKNIHYGNPDKNEVIMNALIDMYHLVYSTYFIPSQKSSFSKVILELRENDHFFN